jgi:DnaJ-domain-containing protein 1
MCESTLRGTFFASPSSSPTMVDWLLGIFSPSSAETFLRIAAWREREGERRRYVFERDGDFRYSSWFERFRWHLRRHEEPAPAREPEPLAIPSPYAILGLMPGASAHEVKQAFLRLVRRFHPDKVHHLGPEHERRAEERFKELMAAYEKLARPG